LEKPSSPEGKRKTFQKRQGLLGKKKNLQKGLGIPIKVIQKVAPHEI
jgi:hypothetical protein